MSRQSTDVVRLSITVSAESHRRLEERLGLRFPRILALAAQVVWSLPSRCRLRQALVRRFLRLSYEAANRGDYEAQVALYHPDGELILPPGLVALGFDRRCRGRDERIRFQQRWIAEWGDFQFAPEELVDLEDGRVFVSGRIVGSGLSSGAAFDDQFAELFTVAAGRAIREQVFLDHAEAHKAAGLAG